MLDRYFISRQLVMLIGLVLVCLLIIDRLGRGIEVRCWIALSLGWLPACFIPMVHILAAGTYLASSRIVRLLLSSGTRCFATSETVGLLGSLLCYMLSPSIWLTIALMTALYSIVIMVIVYVGYCM
ncbi:MAG: hypothetical protein HXY34_08610, partial [Candidatus Thorarchaeota archaeon]|nr:hypothetical protein [Candidatus Thorarchaeota archaeon]